MTANTVTVLRTVDGARMTKKITRHQDGSLEISPYDSGFQFAVEQVPVSGIIELGRLLASLEPDPSACIIRGHPLPDTNLGCCRRLKRARIEHGQQVAATFGSASPRWISLDLDSLPTPVWDAAKLALRRAAILADYARRNTPDASGLPPRFEPTVHLGDDAERALYQIDIAGDADPDPIDPVRDWCIAIRTAVLHLPPEFHDVHAWFQFTGSAGIKPGIRLRLWFWLSRPVSDAEAARWLKDAPVDRALFDPVQPHYCARPVSDPPSADPVPLRSGFWWRHVAAVPVPELPEPTPRTAPIITTYRIAARDDDTRRRRAAAYAKACIRTIENAPDGERHPTLTNAAITIFGLVEHGLIDEVDALQDLQTAADHHGWSTDRRDNLLAWCRATAAADKPLPAGF